MLSMLFLLLQDQSLKYNYMLGIKRILPNNTNEKHHKIALSKLCKWFIWGITKLLSWDIDKCCPVRVNFDATGKESVACCLKEITSLAKFAQVLKL